MYKDFAPPPGLSIHPYFIRPSCKSTRSSQWLASAQREPATCALAHESAAAATSPAFDATANLGRSCAFTRVARRRGPKSKSKAASHQPLSQPSPPPAASTPSVPRGPCSPPSATCWPPFGPQPQSQPQPYHHDSDDSNANPGNRQAPQLCYRTSAGSVTHGASPQFDASPRVPSSCSAHLVDAIADAGSTRSSNPRTSWHQPAPSISSTHRSIPNDPGYSITSLRYPSLAPVLLLIEPILTPIAACQLLDHYFAPPNTSIFTSASPFVLSPVIRQAAMLDRTAPRPTSTALLLAILWVCAHTAHITALLIPRQRRDICDRLGELVSHYLPGYSFTNRQGGPINADPARNPQSSHGRASLDDFLAFLLVAIKRSADDFRDECPFRWQQAVSAAKDMKLHLLDDGRPSLHRPAPRLLGDSAHDSNEVQEEKRRAFWLLFALDRHWALSYNSMPLILEHDCFVLNPLPDMLWNADRISYESFECDRELGPPIRVTDCGFYEYFLPLMTVLGDVLWLHYQRCHPRFATMDNGQQSGRIEMMLSQCTQDLEGFVLATEEPVQHESSSSRAGEWHNHEKTQPSLSAVPFADRRKASIGLYGLFITHVQYVLLHGRWDALDMLSPSATHVEMAHSEHNPVSMSLSDWVTSSYFSQCASHAIAAAETMSKILVTDPELTYMPYLLGIYLLHGSFVLLFFAYRMPEVGSGSNESVEQACENIIRAHEVAVATLSAEFQKDFRKVLRGVLHDVRHCASRPIFRRPTDSQSQATIQSVDVQNGTEPSPRQGHLDDSARHLGVLRDVLGLYRWTQGYQGLAI